MTESDLLPPPNPPPEVITPEPRQPRRDLVPWFYGLGFVILAAAVIYLWQYPSTPSEPVEDKAAIQTIQQRLTEVDARLNKLEQRPTVDSRQVAARLDTLEGRVADQTQLAARLDVLFRTNRISVRS